jgi:hypothetical protein
MRSFSVFRVMLALLIGSASAHEITTNDKMMVAASIVLAEVGGLGGHVVLDSETSAHFVFNASNVGIDVQFKKLADCTFGMTETYSSGDTSVAFIRFDKFSGTYSSNGRDLFFDGASNASCQRQADGQTICWNGLTIYHARYQQRIVDDVSYLARHGCGNTNPDPH